MLDATLPELLLQKSQNNGPEQAFGEKTWLLAPDSITIRAQGASQAHVPSQTTASASPYLQ